MSKINEIAKDDSTDKSSKSSRKAEKFSRKKLSKENLAKTFANSRANWAAKAGDVREKLTAKLPGKKAGSESLRITNDTIAEHREKILAGGRKFKYPLQYSKHKILINTLVIVAVAVVAFAIWLWVMLYKQQSTDDFYYNATQILPLPVANVDGENVPYSSYLRRIRADIYYYQNQENRSFNTTDGKRELSYHQRQDLEIAERYAYAQKLAKNLKITVSDKEVDAEIAKQLKADGTDQASFERMLKTYYNWTLSEYRAEIRSQLTEQKVAFAVDSVAKAKTAKILDQLKNGEDFANLAKSTSDDPLAKNNGGETVAKTGDLDANGLIAAARNLKPGQISGAIAGRDNDGDYCYFIVKLNSITDDTTDYSVIQINLTQFDSDFAKLQSERGKIREYISVPSEKAIENQGN